MQCFDSQSWITGGNRATRQDVCKLRHINGHGLLTPLLETCERTCQELASNQNLNDRGHSMGIDQQVTKNPCQNGAVSKTAMASTLEAVMGAAWLDSGKDWPVTREIATRLYCK